MPHDVEALLIGLIVGGYWARVLKMVIKHRRRTGRDANFVPRERLGRWVRIVWYPTVALWIALPLVYAIGSRFGRLPRWMWPVFTDESIAWVAVIVAGAALAATIECWKRMGQSWRMGIDPAEKTQLIVTGPYAYVRHPIYALSSVLMIASAVAVPVMPMLVVAAVHLLFIQWEARREEHYLTDLHGEAYLRYKRSVGRFFPWSLAPYTMTP